MESPVADSCAPIREGNGVITGAVLVFRDQTQESAKRKRLEAEKAKAQQYLDVAGVIMRALDTKANVTMINKKGCEILGRPEHEVLGKNWYENFVLELDRDRVKGIFSRIISGEQEYGDYTENAVVTRSGEERLIAWHNSVLRDGDGSIIGTLSSGADITERKRAEEALREALDNPSTACRRGPGSWSWADRSCRKRLAERQRSENIMLARLRLVEYAASHPLAELLQATLDEAEALTDSSIGFFHFIDADQKSLLLQAWSTRTLKQMCNAEGKGLHYDLDEAGVWVDCVRERRPVIHNDYSALPHRGGLPSGHAHVVRELVVPVFRGDRLMAILGVGNKPKYYLTSDVETVSLLADLAWDITERKMAEDALRKAGSYNRSLIEASLDPLVTISAEGKITDVNTATEMVTGCSRNELIGTDFVVYFTEPEKARLGYEQVFQDSLVKNYELAIRHKSGGVTSVMYNASLYLDDSGKVVGVFAAARDITDRKRAEEDLIRSNNDLQQFAYVASHDLQEPLETLPVVCNCWKRNIKAGLMPTPISTSTTQLRGPSG